MREIKKHKLDHGDQAKHLGAFVLAGAVQNYCVLLKLKSVLTFGALGAMIMTGLR